MNPLLASILGQQIPGGDDDIGAEISDGIGTKLGSILNMDQIQGQQLSDEEAAAAQEKEIRAKRMARVMSTLGGRPSGVGVTPFKQMSRGQKAMSIVQALADVGAGAFGVESNSLERTADRNRAMDETWKKQQVQLAEMEGEDALSNTKNLLDIGKLKTNFALANSKDAREVVAELMRTDDEAFFEMYGSHPGEDPSVSKQKVDELVNSLPGMSPQDKQRLMVFMSQKISTGRSKYNEALVTERDRWTTRISNYIKDAPPGTPNPLYEKTNKVGKLQKDGPISIPIEFQDMFDRIGNEEGVDPAILAAMAKQESGFDPQAQGQPTKWGTALGMMQILPSNAQKAGIDPFNPEEAVRWAARYVRQAQQNGFTTDEDIAKFYHGGPNVQQWGPLTDAHGKAVASLAARMRGGEAPEELKDGQSLLDEANTKEDISRVGRELAARAAEDAQRARAKAAGDGSTPDQKEAKQLRLKLGSLGGSIDILTDEEKENPYLLQSLVGEHGQLQSKERKMQADIGKTWENAIAGIKTPEGLMKYITEHKIKDDQHLRDYLTTTAQGYINGRKADPTKGIKGQPRLVGTYALGVERKTDQWLADNGELIMDAFEKLGKLDHGTEVVDREAVIKAAEESFRAGEITAEEAQAQIKGAKKSPGAMDLVGKMSHDEILSASDPKMIPLGLFSKKITAQEARKEITKRLKEGTISKDEADLLMSKIDDIAPMSQGKPMTLPSTPSKGGGKKYNPETLQPVEPIPADPTFSKGGGFLNPEGEPTDNLIPTRAPTTGLIDLIRKLQTK